MLFFVSVEGKPMAQESETRVVYFHGGNRGLKVDEYILPPSETGRESTSDFGAPEVHRKDRVYVSTELTHAQFFASRYKKPTVYRVEPNGDIEPDPDCKSGVAFTCLKARVVSVQSGPGKIIKRYQKGDEKTKVFAADLSADSDLKNAVEKIKSSRIYIGIPYENTKDVLERTQRQHLGRSRHQELGLKGRA